MELPADIRFDGWTLHRSSGELLRGEVRVRLASQPLAILEALLARPGEIVTREELIARLWPTGVVDFDTALNSGMRRLRTALGDHAGVPRYIETIPKRGYRFIGSLDAMDPVAPLPSPVVPPEPPAQTAPARHWGRRTAAAAFALGFGALCVVVAGPLLRAFEAVRLADSAQVPATVQASPEARERYVRARHLLQRRGPDDVARALRHFEAAVAIDTRFAEAWAGLASACWLETVEGRVAASEGLPRVRAAAERALSLDPRLAEAHLRLSNYWSRSGRRDLAEAAFRRGRDADPNHPLALAFEASAAVGEGRLDEAIELQRRSLAAEPLSVPLRMNLAVWLYMAGRYGEAGAELQRLREIQPAVANPDGMLSRVFVLERRFDSAIAVAAEATDEADRLQALALAYAGLGRRADSEAVLRKLLDSPQPPDPILIAEVYAYRGERDRAFEWLHLAIDDHSVRRCAESSCWPIELAGQSPFLMSLHADPRWAVWTQAVRARLSRARAATRAG
jgi:DNA-binding winged helix-turn-helix (wHTH) protein/tetratricopeptide (TPR) repeat protein